MLLGCIFQTWGLPLRPSAQSSFIEPEKPSGMKNAQHKEAWEKEGEWGEGQESIQAGNQNSKRLTTPQWAELHGQLMQQGLQAKYEEVTTIAPSNKRQKLNQ